MGSPVSAVIANMYMEAFENTALNDCPPKLEPKIWKRYVDDTFIIVNKHRSKDLLDFMNRRETTIRFTAEHETNGSLAFLDTEVHRQADGTLKTTVYRKPTHTDQYLRYDTHHPQAVKRGLIKCLYDRANRIVSKQSDLSPEQRHLQSALALNGYPKAFIKKSRKPKERIILEEKQFTSTVVLPYVSSIAHQLRRRLEKHNIRAVFKSDTTLRNQLVTAKDPIPTYRKDGVVYQIPCKDCNFSYIGETGRPVKERLTEHQRDVRQRNTILSAVAEHAWEQQHQPDWTGVRCIDSAQHWHTRRVKEAIQIRLHSNTLNRDVGFEIAESWMRCIRQHHSKKTPSTDQQQPPPATPTPSCHPRPHLDTLTDVRQPPALSAGSLRRPHTRYNLRPRTKVSIKLGVVACLLPMDSNFILRIHPWKPSDFVSPDP
ncbi:uncharacterized protein LOC121417737 [Lytechinus variegatus]|uniref:uncharacterized protein LOC121417737 n=1 Tax=Lytechinus variegatus TaxID=7654 RepID=UPI001BB2A691|nr:uncharacterized protein LOC121417737 [Lytechinus variegatus]